MASWERLNDNTSNWMNNKKWYILNRIGLTEESKALCTHGRHEQQEVTGDKAATSEAKWSNGTSFEKGPIKVNTYNKKF